MNNQIQRLLEQLESSQESAAASVADHLRTVASNGPEYSTPEAIKEEALSLCGWALQVAQRITLVSQEGAQQ